LPRKAVNCDPYVFDALVFDRYSEKSTNSTELRQRLNLVYKAMKNELSVIEFNVLKEYYINGKKMKEIARDRGVHPSTVTRQIRRAKEKIKRITKYY